jgi:hypothetical protein
LILILIALKPVDVSIYFTVALYIHQHHQLHQQLNPHTNISTALRLKPQTNQTLPSHPHNAATSTATATRRSYTAYVRL